VTNNSSHDTLKEKNSSAVAGTINLAQDRIKNLSYQK